MNRTRWSAFALIGILLIALQSPALAGSGCGRPHGQAIQFRIGSSFTLSQFDGATLAYLRFVGRDSAWRLNLDLDLQRDSVVYAAKDVGNYDVEGEFEHDEHAVRVAVSSDWLWYRGDRVSVFFGGGPRVSYLSAQDEDTHLSGGSWRHRRTTSEKWGIGLQGAVGVQWAATKWLAVHAEYDVHCMYERAENQYAIWRSGEYEGCFHEVHEVSRFLLDSRGVRFGLSAYF